VETGCRRSRMFAYKMTDWRGNVNSREAARDLTLPRPVCPLYFSRVTCRRGAGRPPTDDGGQCARSSTTDDCRLTRSALRTDRQRSIVLLCHLLRCRPTSHAPPARDSALMCLLQTPARKVHSCTCSSKDAHGPSVTADLTVRHVGSTFWADCSKAE